MNLKSLNEIAYNIVNSIHDTMPNTDTKEGTWLRDVVIDPVSNEIAGIYENIKLVELAQSVLTARGSDLDALASNFFVTRKAATASSGKLRFYFDMSQVQNNPAQQLIIKAGTVVSTVSSTTSPSVTVATTSDAVVSASSLNSFGYDPNTSQYYVEIPAWANQAGVNTNCQANTLTVITSTVDPAVTGVTNPYPFKNGSDQESDTSLTMRLKLALLGANIGTKFGYMGFTLKQNDVLDALVVGAGDPMMLRDNGQGGMVDVYVRGEVPMQVYKEFTTDVYYTTGTGAYLGLGAYSDIPLDYQPLINTSVNSSLTNSGLNLTTSSLDVPNLVGKGNTYTVTYKNAADYSLEKGSSNYYDDVVWDFTPLSKVSATQGSSNVFNKLFPVGTQLQAQYTYLTAIGETTPSSGTYLTIGDNTVTNIRVTTPSILPPGVVSINVYVGQTINGNNIPVLAGSSAYGSNSYLLTSIPQSTITPPIANTAGVAAPGPQPILALGSGTAGSTSNTGTQGMSIADAQALSRTMSLSPSGTLYVANTTTGLSDVSYQDYVNLSQKLQYLTTSASVKNIDYTIDWSNITWYPVAGNDGYNSYATVNNTNVYFDQTFNLGVAPDGTVRIIQVASGSFNPVQNPVPVPTAANRYFVLNNNVWYERRYYQPDFVVKRDTTPTGRGTYEKGTRDSIHWLSNASNKPQVGETLTITYNVNQLISDLQNNIEAKRVLTADVMVKQAQRVGLNVYVEVVPLSGYNTSTIQQQITSSISNYIGQLSLLGGEINKSDIIFIARGITGVLSVGSTTVRLSRTFNADGSLSGLDTYEIQANPYEYFDVDNITVNIMPLSYIFPNS